MQHLVNFRLSVYFSKQNIRRCLEAICKWNIIRKMYLKSKLYRYKHMHISSDFRGWSCRVELELVKQSTSTRVAVLLLSTVVSAWLCSLSPCAVPNSRFIPLARPCGQSVPLDSFLPRHQQNGGAVKCDGPAVSPLTQCHQIECDMHSAATQIWTGFSLHTNLHGLVTGQMLLSPVALAWHTQTHKQTSPVNTHTHTHTELKC